MQPSHCKYKRHLPKFTNEKCSRRSRRMDLHWRRQLRLDILQSDVGRAPTGWCQNNYRTTADASSSVDVRWMHAGPRADQYVNNGRMLGVIIGPNDCKFTHWSVVLRVVNSRMMKDLQLAWLTANIRMTDGEVNPFSWQAWNKIAR